MVFIYYQLSWRFLEQKVTKMPSSLKQKANKRTQEKKRLSAMRHSAEHVLTQAMLKLYPKLVMAMGPATDQGFYFDFDCSQRISEADFPKIEAEMKKIIKKNLPFKKKILSFPEARKLFQNNPYKQEWLDEIQKKGQNPQNSYPGNIFYFF